MPSAQESALSTPEVLEIILIQLPLQDLLINAQRVNHLFHDIIVSSRPLQQALFFRPVEAKGSSNGRVCMNPLLRNRFPPWFENSTIMLNTLLLSNHKQFLSLDWNRSKERTEAYARKDASWRRMLVSQPTVKKIDVKLRVETARGSYPSKGEPKLEDDLRMGPFYDIIEDYVAHQPLAYFVIQWYLPADWESESCGFITIHLRPVIQTLPEMAGKIGPEFKSLGFKSVDIDYHPVIRTPR